MKKGMELRKSLVLLTGSKDAAVDVVAQNLRRRRWTLILLVLPRINDSVAVTPFVGRLAMGPTVLCFESRSGGRGSHEW